MFNSPQCPWHTVFAYIPTQNKSLVPLSHHSWQATAGARVCGTTWHTPWEWPSGNFSQQPILASVQPHTSIMANNAFPSPMACDNFHRALQEFGLLWSSLSPCGGVPSYFLLWIQGLKGLHLAQCYKGSKFQASFPALSICPILDCSIGLCAKYSPRDTVNGCSTVRTRGELVPSGVISTDSGVIVLVWILLLLFASRVLQS